MKCALMMAAGMIALMTGGIARAGLLVVEPDNYADGTVLTNIAPGLTLSTTHSDNKFDTFFKVKARTDAAHASTGTNVFSEEGVPFWTNGFRLRMDFTLPVNGVSIDAIGAESIGLDEGRLELYDAAGTLVGLYVTQPLGPNVIETMSVNHALADISYAVAYADQIAPNTGPFLRLDHLVIDGLNVPEPGTAGMLGLSVAGLLTKRRKWRRGKPSH